MNAIAPIVESIFAAAWTNGPPEDRAALPGRGLRRRPELRRAVERC